MLTFQTKRNGRRVSHQARFGCFLSQFIRLNLKKKIQKQNGETRRQVIVNLLIICSVQKEVFRLSPCSDLYTPGRMTMTCQKPDGNLPDTNDKLNALEWDNWLWRIHSLDISVTWFVACGEIFLNWNISLLIQGCVGVGVWGWSLSSTHAAHCVLSSNLAFTVMRFFILYQLWAKGENCGDLWHLFTKLFHSDKILCTN